jgi:hypothetical protein
MPRRRAAICSLYLLLLAGCAQVGPILTPTPLPTATPPRDVSLPIEVELAASDTAGEWSVFGIAEAGDQSIERPSLQITLYDEEGSQIDQRTVDLSPQPLPSGAAWPFGETFQTPSTPVAAEAVLLGDAAAGDPVIPLRSRALRTFTDYQGRTLLLGSLSNADRSAASVRAVGLLGFDPDGQMRQVLEVDLIGSVVEPGQSVPILARLPRGGEDLAWQLFPIAVGADGPPLPVEVLDQVAGWDDQGNPFVTAVVHNKASVALWLTLTGVVQEGDAWLAGETFALPTPLGPGGRLPFSLRLPGVGFPQEDDLRWEIFPAASEATAQPIPLSSEVIGYEPVGSTLILRVRLTNAESGAVRSPAAFASLTDGDGQTVGAAAGGGPPVLASGESAIVTLALPLRGFDLALGQIDILAYGLPEQETP